MSPGRLPRRFAALFAAVLLVLAGGAAGLVWPELPEKDGRAAIPAQEWPRQPGARTVTVYLQYPEGRLDAVTAQTGLFLTLHNWGGTAARGAPEPKTLAARYNVIAISLDYVQSGKYDADKGIPYDYGYFQALDALRALWWVRSRLDAAGTPFARGRVFATGGSGGGNVTLMCNKLAPRTFACAIDICGMAKLADDMAFGLNTRSRLNAGYAPDPESPRYLNPDAQAIRFAGHPDHAAVMQGLGNGCKLIPVHGVEDKSCPVEDKRELVRNYQAAGLDVEPHFITPSDVDGKVFTSAGHALGNRTEIVRRVAEAYLAPESPKARRRVAPADFDLGGEVRYPTPNGVYVISYAKGCPAGRFQPADACQ